MQNCYIDGRLVADPEIVQTTGDSTICRFKIATTRDYKDKKDGEYKSDFFQFTAFGKTGEFVNKYFKKGDGIQLRFKMENNNYTDKDGQMKYQDAYKVVEVAFPLGKGTGKSEVKAEGGAPATEASAPAAPPPMASSNLDDDDMPF